MRPYVLRSDVDRRELDDVWARIEARRARASWFSWLRALTTPRWALAAAVPGLLTCALVWWFHTPSDVPRGALRLASGALAPATWVAEDAALERALDDGSRVVETRGTELSLRENDASRVGFALGRGDATFDIRPHGPRTWTIDAGPLVVTVLGTKFTVSRDASGARVDVERGRVSVSGLGIASRVLQAGESFDTHVRAVPALPAPPVVTAAPHAPSVAPVTSAPPLPARESVRESVRETTIGERVDEARSRRDPSLAASLLERELAEHPAGASAATWTFTLGKIYLDELAQPARAATAFGRALQLPLPAALREDAHARRVEALARAGDSAGASLAREAYERAYPSGAWTAAVQKWAP